MVKKIGLNRHNESLDYSVTVYTPRPYLSAGSIVIVTTLHLFTANGFIKEDAVQASNMLANKWVLHLDDFHFEQFSTTQTAPTACCQSLRMLR